MRKKSPKFRLFLIIGAVILILILSFVLIKNNSTYPQSGAEIYKKNGEVEYFIQIIEGPLSRWTKNPVLVGVDDATLGDKPFTTSRATSVCIDKFISDFNKISKEIKLKRTYWFPEDIDITLVTQQKIVDLADVYTEFGWGEQYSYLRDKAGFTEYAMNEDFSLDYTRVFVSVDLAGKDYECELLYHELMHALGFPNHPTKEQDPSSVFVNGESSFENFSHKDKMLIDTMYNSDVPVGSSAEETREFLGSNP